MVQSSLSRKLYRAGRHHGSLVYGLSGPRILVSHPFQGQEDVYAKPASRTTRSSTPGVAPASGSTSRWASASRASNRDRVAQALPCGLSGPSGGGAVDSW